MSFISWRRNRSSNRPSRGRPPRRPTAPGFRPRLEALEDRTLPSTYHAATAADLINAINAANKHGGSNTITLTAPTTSPYVLTAVNNTTDGNTMLPVIASGDSLTIQTEKGRWDAIDASKLGRLFDVASGASLSLIHVTLQNGQVSTGADAAKGGAVLNQGSLVLSGVTILNNSAVATAGNYAAAGGGIWSNGSITVNDARFQGNSALSTTDIGGNAYGGAIDIAGGTANITGSFFGYGNTAQSSGIGQSYGGALYIAGATVTMSGDTVGGIPRFGTAIQSNSAQSQQGAYGGGLYVASGTVTLTQDTISYNEALGYPPSSSHGGGIYIASGAHVSIDVFTYVNTQANFPDDIYGTYTATWI